MTAGLVAWLVLWALGAKSFDASMLAVLFIVIGMTGELLKRFLPSRRQ